MTSLLITGYSSFDLGIFNDKDVRVKVIKKAIRLDLERLLDEGLDWLIFTGNLGFEFWALEIAKELQADYGFQIATIFTFENQGENWNETNQAKLAYFKEVDFVKYAYPCYENPSQFREYNQFLVQNTDMAYLFYDSEKESKLKYLYDIMRQEEDYSIKRLSFDDLNDIAENFSKN